MGTPDAWLLMLRAELSVRWRAMVILTLFVAVGAGITVGTAATAERTATAFQRLLDRNAAADLLFDATEIDGADVDLGMVPRSALDAPTLAGVPGITVQAAGAGVLAFFPDVPGLRLADLVGTEGPPISVVTLFALDDQFGRTIERPSVLRGRLPDPHRADEILVSEGFADFAGVSVGDHLTISWLRAGAGGTMPDPADPAGRAAFEQAMGRTDAVITGIGTPIHRDRSGIDELVMMTPAFGDQPGVLVQYTFAVARVAAGTNPADVIAAAGERGLSLQQTSADAIAGYRDSVRPDVVSLTIFALVAGIITVLVVGQGLGREVRLGGADNGSRRAIGATTGQLASVALTRAGLIVACGVGLGTIAAASSSGWFLRGAAAAVEPTPGFRVDPLLVLGIAALLAIGCVLLAVWPAISAGRATRPQGLSHASWLAETLTSWGAPPLTVVGVRHAVERGDGRAGVPMRTALAVGSLGVGLAVAALVFTSGLDRLVGDPSSYGVTWQMQIDTNYDNQRDAGDAGSCDSADGRCGDHNTVLRERMSFLHDVVADHADIAAATPYSNEILEIDGRTTGVYAMGEGAVQPTLTEGRRPDDGEIALGHAVMAELGVRVGDSVTTATGVQLRVVGVALVPDGLPGESLGHGGVITSATAQRLDARAVPRGFLMRTTPGADTNDLLDGFRALMPSEEFGVEGPPQPAQIADYRRIRDTPIVLALSVTVVGTGMLIVGVRSAVRRRRHEYALLQALGATRHQIVSTIQTQTIVSYGVVLLFGLPIGIIGGGAVWNAFEGRLGTRAGLHWPLITIVAAALVGAVVTVLLVQPIARRRSMGGPALELRYE